MTCTPCSATCKSRLEAARARDGPANEVEVVVAGAVSRKSSWMIQQGAVDNLLIDQKALDWHCQNNMILLQTGVKVVLAAHHAGTYDLEDIVKEREARKVAFALSTVGAKMWKAFGRRTLSNFAEPMQIDV